MIVVSPVTKTILSIGFRCGMGSFSRNLIFSRGDLQYISPIILTVALPLMSLVLWYDSIPFHFRIFSISALTLTYYDAQNRRDASRKLHACSMLNFH